MGGQPKPTGKGYGRRPLWQWIMLYVVIGGIIYGLIYYFALAGKDGYQSPGTTQEDSVY